jgi:hypothetical protein
MSGEVVRPKDVHMDELAQPLLALIAGATIGIGVTELGKRVRKRLVRVRIRPR